MLFIGWLLIAISAFGTASAWNAPMFALAYDSGTPDLMIRWGLSVLFLLVGVAGSVLVSAGYICAALRENKKEARRARGARGDESPAGTPL